MRERIWAHSQSGCNEVDLRLARDGRGPDMAMLVLDLGAVPCCESHERMERAVRGTGKEGGADREAGGQDEHWACRRGLGDKIA